MSKNRSLHAVTANSLNDLSAIGSKKSLTELNGKNIKKGSAASLLSLVGTSVPNSPSMNRLTSTLSIKRKIPEKNRVKSADLRELFQEREDGALPITADLKDQLGRALPRQNELQLNWWILNQLSSGEFLSPAAINQILSEFFEKSEQFLAEYLRESGPVGSPDRSGDAPSIPPTDNHAIRHFFKWIKCYSDLLEVQNRRDLVYQDFLAKFAKLEEENKLFKETLAQRSSTSNDQEFIPSVINKVAPVKGQDLPAPMRKSQSVITTTSRADLNSSRTGSGKNKRVPHPVMLLPQNLMDVPITSSIDFPPLSPIELKEIRETIVLFPIKSDEKTFLKMSSDEMLLRGRKQNARVGGDYPIFDRLNLSTQTEPLIFPGSGKLAKLKVQLEKLQALYQSETMEFEKTISTMKLEAQSERKKINQFFEDEIRDIRKGEEKAIREVEDLRKSKIAMDREMDLVRDAQIQLNADYLKIKDEVSEAHGIRLDLEKQLAASKAQLLESEMKILQLKKGATVLEDRLTHSKDENEQSKVSVQRFQAKIHELNQTILSLEELLAYGRNENHQLLISKNALSQSIKEKEQQILHNHEEKSELLVRLDELTKHTKFLQQNFDRILDLPDENIEELLRNPERRAEAITAIARSIRICNFKIGMFEHKNACLRNCMLSLEESPEFDADENIAAFKSIKEAPAIGLIRTDRLPKKPDDTDTREIKSQPSKSSYVFVNDTEIEIWSPKRPQTGYVGSLFVKPPPRSSERRPQSSLGFNPHSSFSKTKQCQPPPTHLTSFPFEEIRPFSHFSDRVSKTRPQSRQISARRPPSNF